MGKLSIVGNAEKEYKYDVMELEVEFKCSAVTTKEATRKAAEQCEEFLSIIKGKGVPSECIKAGDNSIEKDTYGERREITATREVTIKTALDIPLLNCIVDVISENDYSADFETHYSFSDERKIYDELLEEAIEDSKRRATFIANAMGQKITGIKSVGLDRSNSGSVLDKYMNSMKFSEMDYLVGSLQHTNALEAPTVKKASSVEVIWNLERDS